YLPQKLCGSNSTSSPGQVFTVKFYQRQRCPIRVNFSSLSPTLQQFLCRM
ncbi:112_t:CDS:1, partial [Funneliformis geosporum]